ncbi:hypothetical protein DPMN_141938 [Dreissena polymorpha]|uniref:Uncharacterized protein n=1 Tax=Dreissena polymorpha TaxID=45954 RepID=A0A9D4GDN1_DREPO|nr:hypothetical protein DPMN_141938 [Dreissena polymorpha]
MEEVICIYCDFSISNFGHKINHCISKHESTILKIKISNYCATNKQLLSYSKDVQTISKELKSSSIIANNETKTKQTSKCEQESPLKKFLKPTTPVKYVHRTLKENSEIGGNDEADLNFYFEDMSLLETSTVVQTESCIVEKTDAIEERDIETVEYLSDKIPAVLEYFKSENQVEMYVKFTTILAERKLPLSNIAVLLFVDIVEWFLLESIRDMRYSEDEKQFWRIGLQLF